MDRLRCLQIFTEVARCGSFARAAMQLSLSRATVTKHVAWLESSMGAQLLKRSSKQVALTEAGARVLETGRDLLERYEAIEGEVRDVVHLPRGAIRVGTPPSFGAYHLMRLISQFTHRYPDIEVTVVHDDGRSDLVTEALDLSIRIAPSLEDASYIAQSLMKSPQVVVASPAYLKRHGRPATAADLARHNCLVHIVKSSAGVWKFAGDPPQEVRVRGTVRSNLGDAIKQAALLGTGISLHPYYMVSEELRAGTLEALLPGSVPEELDIYVVFSTRRNMPTRVRHLLEFLKEWSRHPPDWALPAAAGATRPRASRTRSPPGPT
ncbi:LysR family transcriptional regulator [Variovorax sp. RA8]|uniref:LysR family transcriptional regulator n=1 Tax=Variovorax sp. (strain JCM 16519 / RA8) TaxID=662548 RepID=UPI0013A5BD07|nr:LysR family transcriptional regulator [Variovorax sp. RA8]